MKKSFASMTLMSTLLMSYSAWGQSAVTTAPHAGKISHPLVGAWRLLQYVDTPDGAEPIHAFGERPVGQFVFTKEGQFSVNIMRNPPAPAMATVDIDPDACIPAWYCSYFGSYRLAGNGRQWITHVDGGNIPSYVGTSQTRSFQIAGNRLTIRDTYEEGGRTVRARRVLERVQGR